MSALGINPARVQAIFQREQARFHEARPKSAALLARAKLHMPNGVPCAWMDGLYFHEPVFASHGKGAYFWDVDGHQYLDMNQADLSMNCGYGPEPLVKAVEERVRNGAQFLLPVQDSIEVSEALAERYRLPFWQYTLSASSANIEAIRIARAFTGKQYVLVFNGKYHGHIDDTMGSEDANQDSLGFRDNFSKQTLHVEFNDLASVEYALKNYPVACVMCEPALSNLGVIQPHDGFFDGLRALCNEYQSLLIIDETHTQICAWGGLSRAWNITADMLTLGKTVAAGIATGVYGMSTDIAEFVATHLEADNEADARTANGGLALGGTLYGNALSMAAAKVALNDILTPQAYDKTTLLGANLSMGLQTLFDNYDLPWKAQSLFSRSGYTFGPELPNNSQEYEKYADPILYNAMRAFYANRGVWESISSAGPAVSFVMEQADIDKYLAVVEAFLIELTGDSSL
jgi:glutamate-1-semialdehyde 2,1-aminomutase